MGMILGLILSYFIGSIPTAYLFGRLFKGIDIRRHGSGNVGATNAFRVLGPKIGIAVLLIDAIKGVIPVVFLADFLPIAGQSFISDITTLRVLLGVTAVLGHSFTVFLKFKGGKGMATTLGVLIGLSIEIPTVKIILILEVAIWLALFLLSRIVSLASVVSAITFPIFFVVFKQATSLVIMSLSLAIFIIYRHKSNIYRLLHNQEPRLNLRKASK